MSRTSPERTVSVDRGRLAGWCTGFADRHGEPVGAVREGTALVLTAPDGAVARIEPPFPLPADVEDLPGLLAWTGQERRCAVLLVRRGGYGCALVVGDRVTASKVGTRYVQGRTAAGGWSQQRFARRRDNQARHLVDVAALTAERILLPDPPAQWLVTGGDRALVEQVLEQPRLRGLTRLPRGPYLPVGDPRSEVVKAVPGLLARVRIVLHDPDPTGD